MSRLYEPLFCPPVPSTLDYAKIVVHSDTGLRSYYLDYVAGLFLAIELYAQVFI
jgi:hypothetical protein